MAEQWFQLRFYLCYILLLLIFLDRLLFCLNNKWPLVRVQYLFEFAIKKEVQESIPVGCVPPACQPYMFWWPPLGVSSGGWVFSDRSHVWGGGWIPPEYSSWQVPCLGVSTHSPTWDLKRGGVDTHLPPPNGTWETVGKRSVRILLECFLVIECTYHKAIYINNNTLYQIKVHAEAFWKRCGTNVCQVKWG